MDALEPKPPGEILIERAPLDAEGERVDAPTRLPRDPIEDPARRGRERVDVADRELAAEIPLERDPLYVAVERVDAPDAGPSARS